MVKNRIADVADLVDQPHGGALLNGGIPGNKGGGRPPNEFKQRMAALVSRDDVERYLEECLSGAHGPKIFLQAYEMACNFGYGKPSQPIDVRASEPLIVKVVRE